MKSKNLKKNYFYNLKKEPSKYYELSRKINFLTKGFDNVKIVFLSNFTLPEVRENNVCSLPMPTLSPG